MEAARSALHQSPPRWSPGELVRVRGDRWRLEHVQVFAACELLRLAGEGRTNRGRRATLLWPFDRPARIDRSALHRATWPQWRHAFRALIGATAPAGRLRTAARASIDLHPYQIEPALAVLNGLAARLLLADEVGLGKTVEAGLVLAELQARDEAARTLILTPAGLRDQWAGELRGRFGIEATVVDATTVRRTLARIAAGTNPWSVWPVVIASIDFVKRLEVLRALDPFTWDVLVVDEAHGCGMAPERSAAVRTLARRARRVILLTATPHGGDDRAFDALCGTGRIDAADRIVMFRRSRSDVGLASGRRVRLVRVRCTAAELRMHRALGRYTRAVWTSDRAGTEARLAMIVLRKRALSSASSLVRSLERRLDALFDVPPDAAQLALPFAGAAEPDEQTLDDDEPAGCLAAPGLEGRRERDWLLRVLAAARLAQPAQSKMTRLLRLLRRVHQPTVVFTEYRDTARWLVTVLEQLGPVVLLHGGLSRIERREVEERFRSGAADTLVATDAAAEGLNLHQRCRLVVNLELPWNPMRLEQRIGRVDRLGQTRRPHAVHLVARGTAEEQIVWRLAARQERARRSIGALNDVLGTLREQDVAAAVMNGGCADHRGVEAPTGECESPRAAPFVALDLRETARAEARRVAFVRTLLRAGAPRADSTAIGPADAAACIALLPRRRARRCGLPPGLMCVFVVRLVSGTRETVDSSLVALCLGAVAPRLDATAIEALKRVAVEHFARHLRDATAIAERVRAAATAREEAIAAADARPAAALQPGMFDRRALAADERETAAREARTSERSERLIALRAGPIVARADLALVLRVPGPLPASARREARELPRGLAIAPGVRPARRRKP